MTNKTIIQRLQRIVGTDSDGILGPLTRRAIADYTGEDSSETYPSKTQIRSGKSPYGKAGHIPMLSIHPPYPLHYAGKVIEKISVHERIAPAVERALGRILQHYGRDRLHALGLDIYDGCYNNRRVRGGYSTSMHAWAIAFDFDAAHNGNSTRGDRARFTTPEYDFWWLAWMSVGARPFGLFNNRDYMHIEFTLY